MKIAKICITNLKLKTIIGINDWERENKQEVTLNICFKFNASQAMESDNINDTIDYYELEKSIITHVESSAYQLIEKLAAQIIQLIFNEPNVLEVTVSVAKPEALERSDSVSFEITETKSE